MGDALATPIGSVLGGRYRLDAMIGAGGMGTVYRAEHVAIHRPVAIKVLHAELGLDRGAVDAFRREAFASGQLDHPNIVAVSDFDQLPDGSAYLVMELLDGEPLSARIDAGPMPWHVALGIMRGILAGLELAHDRGIVHCDVKPDNIFLARKHGDVFVKVLDFGVAKLVADAHDDGTAMGTPAYLSPEQARGAPITASSDLYSASIVLYEMLTGRPPFEEATHQDMLIAHMTRPPAPFDPQLGIPAQLEEVVRAGLGKTPEERIATARAYLGLIERVQVECGFAEPPRASPFALAPPPVAAEPAAGTYDIVQPIGAGGMAEVFLARQKGPLGLEKLVALKCIRRELAADARFVELFLDEARLAARITDPHVAHILDLGEMRGIHYIAMEYLDGETLDAILGAHATGVAAPPPPVVARIVAEVAAGLDAAHELRDASGRPLGLVHRDVTPSNIVVLYSGAVKVLDFGVAKARERLGDVGVRLGKPGYMSPEQVGNRDVDRRSDVFSLGVVLWEALAGRSLFAARSRSGTLDRITRLPIVPPSQHAPVPPELDAIVLRALARDPDARYQTAGALRVALETFLFRAPASALDVAAYMRAAFPDRMAARQRLVEAALHGGEVPAEVSIAPAPRHEPTTTLVTDRPRRVRTVLVAGAIALACGAVAIAIWKRPTSEPAVEPAAVVSAPSPSPSPPAPPPTKPAPVDPTAALLDRAEKAIEDGKIFGSGGDSALELLAEAERGHPGGERAAKLRERLEAKLRKDAEALWEHGKADSARVVYGELRRVAPDDATARARGTVAPSTRPDAARVTWLVTQIDLAIIERRFVAPEGRNALDFLLELRKLDPDNAIARRLGTEVATALVAEAKDHPADAGTLLAAATQARGETTVPAGPAGKGSGSGSGPDPRAQARDALASGRTALAAGHYDEATAAFQRVLAVDPASAAALAGIAEVAFNQGDHARAVLSAKRAVELAPGVAGYRMTLAKSLYKLMRYDDAIAQWKKVLELDPGNATARQNIELAERKAGR